LVKFIIVLKIVVLYMSRSNILASALNNDKRYFNAEGFENAEGFGTYAQATGKRSAQGRAACC
jgi:hypothetical protein